MARTRETDLVVFSALRERKITLWLGGGGLAALALAILWLCGLPSRPPGDGLPPGVAAPLYDFNSIVTNTVSSEWAEYANGAVKKPLTTLTSTKQPYTITLSNISLASVTDTCRPVPGQFGSTQFRVWRGGGSAASPPAGNGLWLNLDTLYDLVWSPPFSDLQELSFSVQPDNPSGPPPYVWSNQAADAPEPIVATYRYPSAPVRDRGWSIVYAMYQDAGKWYSLEPSMVLAEFGAASGSPRLAATPAASRLADAEYMTYLQFIQGEADMTPDLCQAFSDALAAGYLFVAVQAPLVADEENPGTCRSALLAEQPPLASSLELTNAWDRQAGFLARLMPAPEYVNALEQAYPSPPGLAWTALKAVAPPDRSKCSAFPKPGGWNIWWTLLFEKAADNQAFQSYFCYRGGNPFVIAELDRIAGASGRRLRTTSAAGGPCVTCLGPTNVSLHEYGSAFDVEWSWFELNVQPDGRRIAFPHAVLGLPGVADLRYEYLRAAPGPLPWGFYGETAGNYDLSKPISTISADGTLWLVSDPVNGDTAPGDYSLQVTVAPQAGGAAASTTDSVWVYPLYGDVNEDKATNALDSALLAWYLAEKARLSELGKLAADYNQDTVINARDLVSLCRAIVTF